MNLSWLEELIWDDENVEHIARHGVGVEEAEQVIFDESTMAVTTDQPLRLFFIGLTEAGRFLAVVVARVGERQGRCVTARPASRKERDAYKKWREQE